ncbi:MAG TPA: ABC transporter permease [Casimicrobiaceae bacterium]|nr:ABC transporter permease [Casimicrobiaceae bacterium]
MKPRGQGPSLLLHAVAFLGFVYLIAPVSIVAVMSLSSSRYLAFPPPGWSTEWYAKFFTDGVWLSATANSFRLGVAVALIATPLGTLAAYGLVRRRVPAQRAIAALLLSPMVVPVIVAAISLYAFYVALGLAGGFLGILVAHVVLAVPLVTIAVAASLRRLDPVIERAAASLGADPLRVFLTAVLPNIVPGVVSGAVFAFITSFDELVIAMFVGGRTMTLPRKIWEDLVVLIEPTQAAASMVLVAVSIVALGIWAAFQRRSERRT